MNPMRICFVDTEHGQHQVIVLDSDHLPMDVCFCGAKVTGGETVANAFTTEYKSRCLTTSKNYTDDRKAPGS